MNDDPNQDVDIAQTFDDELKLLALALADASYLLSAQTKRGRGSDTLPAPNRLNVIQGIIDDAAGHISNFAFEMDRANHSYGRTDLLAHPERFMSDEELAELYPEDFGDGLGDSTPATPRSLDRSREGIELLAIEFLDELGDDEPYVHRSPTRNLGSLRHLPIDDFDPTELDGDDSWTDRIGDRGGRSIE